MVAFPPLSVTRAIWACGYAVATADAFLGIDHDEPIGQPARLLGINRVTLWNRMKKYGIDLNKVLTV
jgi:hypothetical protein